MNLKGQKWDPIARKYDPYMLPEGCRVFADLEDIVACASCGEEMPFGNMYTSLQIHTMKGNGYSVCEDCYAEEKEYERRAIEERRSAWKSN